MGLISCNKWEKEVWDIKTVLVGGTYLYIEFLSPNQVQRIM